MAIEIPLKKKYTEPKSKGHKSKSSTSGTRDKLVKTLKPRRKAYGPF